MRAEFLTGLESWFTLPAQPGAAAPPPYKMALVTWVTIFPLITLVVVASAPLIGRLPLVPRLAVTTLVTVSLIPCATPRRGDYGLPFGEKPGGGEAH